MASVATITGKEVSDATSITHSISTGSGNLLLAVCGSRDTTNHSINISDSDWEEVVRANAGAPYNMAIGVWKLKAATTGASESLTVNSALTSDVLIMHLIEISGANSVADYVVKSDADTELITYVLRSVATPSPGCLVIGSAFVFNADIFTPSGYTGELKTTNYQAFRNTRLGTVSKEYIAEGATGDVTGLLNIGTEGITVAYYSVHLALSEATGGGTSYGDIFMDHAF